MYRAVLADDEEVIREGLKTLIDWKSLDLELVGIAGDGLRALELVRELNPEILVTDIRMPRLDGIQLIREVRKTDPEVRIIIISGYDDFEYVKAALKSGVSDYFLKPIDEHEFCSILRDQVREMDKRIVYNANLNEGRDLIRDKTLNRLVNGTISRADLFEKMRFLDADLSAEAYRVAVFNMEGGAAPSGEELEYRKTLLCSACENVPQRWPVLFGFFDWYHRPVVIAGGEEAELDDECLLRLTEKIRREAAGSPELHIAAGIGGKAVDVLDIRRSYQEASEALKLSILYGKDATLFSGAASGHGDVKAARPGKTVNDIVEYVKCHYRSNITLKNTSEVFFMNPAYLGRIFKMETGVNFTDFVHRVRMEEAKKLLLSGEWRISEIAEKCGYRDVDYFRLMFRKYTGTQLAEYRKRG